MSAVSSALAAAPSAANAAPAADGGTVIVNEYRHLAAGETLPSWMPTYKGLPIHSLPELHEWVAARVREHVPAGGSILDLAAGSGALTLRLADLGYAVTGCDYVRENFRLHDKVAFRQVNLNTAFDDAFKGEKFDAIVASEILEHIENPRHVLRRCAALLKPGGTVLITTPNIESSFSIAMRLRTGCFSLFDDAYYRRDGHITPITSTLLKQALAEAGFALRRFETAGGHPGTWWKMRLLIRLIDRLRSDTPRQGSSLVAVAALASAGPAA
jgi:SAM-dependent methyltransferase